MGTGALRFCRRKLWSEAHEEVGLEKALQVLCELGTSPPDSLYLSFLKACYQRKASALARQLYQHLRHQHPSAVAGLVADYLVITFAKCGDLEHALHVFHELPQRNIYVWTAIISGFTDCGRGHEALELHQHMKADGVDPNHFTFVSLLKACGNIPRLHEGQKLHAEVQQKGLASDVFVGSSLVSMYGKCGRLEEAENVFFKLLQRSVVTWNGMLSAYVQQDQGEKALQLYRHMIKEGICPNDLTLVIVLQACGMLADKEEPTNVSNKLIKVVASSIGQALHAVARQKGITENIANGLVSLYSKCSSVEEAENVFCAFCQHSVVTWNSMISTYAENGQGKLALQLCCHMQQLGVSPDEWTFVGALQAGGNIAEQEESVIVGGELTKPMSLDIGQALHNDAEREGFASHIYVGNSLLTLYNKCGSIAKAESVFVGLPQPNLVSWNAMLSAYADHGQEGMALHLFRQMQEERECPNEQTFTIVIHACGSLAVKEQVIGVEESRLVALKVGQALHSDVWRKGVASSVYVGNTLVSMYSKCGKIAESEHAFQGSSQWNTVSWNAMLSAYNENGYGEKALLLFGQMLEEGFIANKLTFRTVLQACGTLADKDESTLGERHSSNKGVALKIVQALHVDAKRMGFDKDVSIVSTLMSVFSKCEMVMNASCMFETCQKNIMLFNVMLSIYVEHGLGEKALQLYRQIPDHCIADDVTLVYILQACSDLGYINDCRELHFILISSGHDVGSAVSTTLIHTYGFCATMIDAETVLHGLAQPDVVSWSACLAGYARKGSHIATLRIFQDMEVTGVEPNRVSFLSLLHACSHAGLVYRGVECFESMHTYFRIRPDLKCYAGMIDLLGRAGDFTRMMNLLWRIPVQDDLPIWLCVLSACCIHGNTELGRWAFDYTVSLQPEEATSYILMSNISEYDE